MTDISFDDLVPAGAAAAPTTPQAGSWNGYTQDRRNSKVWRNPDGTVGYVGNPSTGGEGSTGTVVDVRGSSDPEAIASFLAANPDVPEVDDWAAGPPAEEIAAGPEISFDDLVAESSRPGSEVAAEADARGRVGRTTPDAIRNLAQGASLGFADELDAGAAALETGFSNLVNPSAKKYGMREAYSAVMAANKEAADAALARDPLGTIGMQVVGGVMSAPVTAGAKFIGAAGTFGGAVGRSAAVGAGTGAASGFGVADGNVLNRVGGAATGAAIGAAGGAALPLAAQGVRTAVGAVRRGRQAATPELEAAAMAEAGEALEEVGVNISQLSPPAMGRLGDYIRQGRSPREAALAVVANTELPVPLPMTRGDRTGDPGQQLTENLMLRGARGSAASRHMRGLRSEQQEALRGNVDAIADRVAGGQAPTRGVGAQVASDRLNTMYDEAEAGVNAAYDAARATEGGWINSQKLGSLGRDMRSALSDYDNQHSSLTSVMREVGRLDELSNAGPIGVRDLFDARARLTKLKIASGDRMEASAASQAVRALDDHISTAVDNDLLSGDPAAVTAWREAIGRRREFGKLFEGGDLIESLTERVARGGEGRTLKVDTGDAANYIFGRSDLGFIGRQNLYRDVTRLRSVLGPDSAEWNALRAEAFQRLASQAEGGVEFGSRQFSGVKFAKGWNDLRRKDARLAAVLFTEPERALLDKFAALSARVTAPVKGGDNSSNTAVAGLRLLGNLSFLRGLPVVKSLGDELEVQVNLGAARRATTQTPGPASRDQGPANPLYFLAQ